MSDPAPSLTDGPSTGQPEATRTAGLATIERFAPRMGKAYAGARNYDYGPGRHTAVSMLSPYVRHRLVLERECVDAALAVHGLTGAEKFIQEVFWRTYWKGWLEGRPSVWQTYKDTLDRALSDLGRDGDLRSRYDAAVDGRTGLDCFDSWAEELVETGYLHNHARMWFASIWIFTLRLPWVLGADLFFRHLLDGDPASNTLSWRWVAGLHTKGKNYIARASNITKYTDDRFVGTKGLAIDPAPLDEDTETPPHGLPDLPGTAGRGAYGLILTEDDLCPETLGLNAQECAGVAGVLTTDRRSPLETGTLATQFAADAMADGLARSQDWCRQTGAAPAVSQGADLVAWAQDLPVKRLVLARPAVGPVTDTLMPVLAALRADGFEIAPVTRAWDRAAWPHAGKGFFGLKKQIPKILNALEPSLFD